MSAHIAANNVAITKDQQLFNTSLFVTQLNINNGLLSLKTLHKEICTINNKKKKNHLPAIKIKQIKDHSYQKNGIHLYSISYIFFFLFLPFELYVLNLITTYLDKIAAVSSDFSNLSLSSKDGLFNIPSKAAEYGALVLDGGFNVLTKSK